MKYIQLLSNTSNSLPKNYGVLPYILALISAISYPFTWLYCNQKDLTVAQNSFVRGLANFGCHFILCRLTNSSLHLKQQKSYKNLIYRSSIMTIYSGVISLAQFILPLPIVHTINSSGVIFVFMIDYFINGIQINKRQAIGITVGLIGVLVMGNQRFLKQLFGFQSKENNISNKESLFQNYLTDDIKIISAFTILYICTMIAWAYGVTLTKNINANTYQINFIMGLMIYIFGVVLFPYSSQFSQFSKGSAPETKNAYVYKLFLAFLLTGIPITFAQTLFIAALRMSDNAGIISMINFLSVGVSYAISIGRYHQKVQMLGLLGVGFVFYGVWKTITESSSWIMIKRKKQENKTQIVKQQNQIKWINKQSNKTGQKC